MSVSKQKHQLVSKEKSRTGNVVLLSEKSDVAKQESENVHKVESAESFSCMTCGASFSSERELGDHNILVHRPQY